MTGEDLIDSMEYVDEKIVEEALTCSCVKRRWYRPVLAVAACLVVVLAVGMLGNRKLRPELTAALVWDAFNGQDEGIADDGHRTFRYSAMKGYQPWLGLLPTSATVPVYQRNTEERITLGATRPLYLQQNQILERLCDALWIDVPEELSVADQGGYKILSYENGLNYYECFSVQRSERAVNYENKYALRLDGKNLTIDISKSDEEIIAALEPVKQRLFEIFGVEFPDVKFLRGDAMSRICYFDESAHPMNQYKELPVTDRIVIEFSGRDNHSKNPWGDTKMGSRIDYYRYLLEPQKHYPTMGEYKLLSLDEAEQELAQGHSFGGVCSQCREEAQRRCSHYDYVRFEYFWAGDRNDNLYIPVYGFLFEDGECDGTVYYRVLYVCAAKVEGLDRYFEDN